MKRAMSRQECDVIESEHLLVDSSFHAEHTTFLLTRATPLIERGTGRGAAVRSLSHRRTAKTRHPGLRQLSLCHRHGWWCFKTLGERTVTPSRLSPRLVLNNPSRLGDVYKSTRRAKSRIFSKIIRNSLHSLCFWLRFIRRLEQIWLPLGLDIRQYRFSVPGIKAADYLM